MRITKDTLIGDILKMDMGMALHSDAEWYGLCRLSGFRS